MNPEDLTDRRESQVLPADVLILTSVARRGLVVRDVFLECLSHGVQALPYCDASGRVTGRVTLKHIINRSLVPAHLAELAPVVGSNLSSFRAIEKRIPDLFQHPVETYLQEPHASIYSDTPLLKALAIMEHFDTSYLFVVDDGAYRGTLTIARVARWIIRMDHHDC